MCRGRGVDATQSPPAGPRRRFARAQVVPFIFGEAWGWFTPILALVVAWALLGIEAAAVECERPVRGCANHMPLEAFCAVVADNVRQTLQHSAGMGVKLRRRIWDAPPTPVRRVRLGTSVPPPTPPRTPGR